MTRLLVVDDEPQILRALRINLHARQYDVVTAGTGKGALDAATEAHPDLVILDLGLPDMDGVEVIRSLRKWTQVPIVILSGRLNSAAKVDALDAGADDYVTKPFSVEELLARIRAVTRRITEPELIEPVQLGRWTVDLSDHVIYETLPANRGASDTQLQSDNHIEELAHQVHLTPIEWQLLQALVRHPGRLVSQRHLLQEVWGPTYVEQTHYCVNTSRRSGTSSKMIQLGHATSSPSLEWATASSPNTRWNHRQNHRQGEATGLSCANLFAVGQIVGQPTCKVTARSGAIHWTLMGRVIAGRVR